MRPSPKALKQRRIPLFIIGILFLLSLLTPQAVASKGEIRGKFILIVIDQVGIAELKEAKLPTMIRLTKGGAIGAMNIRTPVQDSTSAGYTTIGAGGKAVGANGKTSSGESVRQGWDGFGADERMDNQRVADIFYERTGRTVKAPTIVNLSINQIVEANKEEDLGTKPGALGETLQAAGLKTAALGNSDTAHTYGRAIVNTVMDAQGEVDYGDVSQRLLKKDAAFPTGLRTDQAKLFDAFASAYQQADVIAIDWGDTSRVEAESSYLSASVALRRKREALRGADQFLAQLLQVVDLKKDRIIILAPNASPAAVKGESLMTPAIMAGKGVQEGILITPTTKRDGVIINIDIAPTVLSFFNIKAPIEMIGQEVKGAKFSQDPFDYLVKANQGWVTKAQFDAPVLRVLAGWDVLIIFTFMMMMLFPAYRIWARRGRVFLLTVAVVPLALLLVPMLKWESFPLIFADTIILTALMVALISWRIKESADALIIIGFATVAAVVIDLVTGANLARQSLIGPSVVTGARFYGLGNEFAGVLIGATIIGSTALLDRLNLKEGKGKWLVLGFTGLFMLIVAFVIGHPALGANFGMLLAALAAFGIALLGFTRGKIGIKEIFGLAVVSVLIIGAIFLYDMTRSVAAESHIGRLLELVRIQGMAPLTQTIQRKVMMNIKLLQFAFWNWVNVASLIVLLVSAYSLKDLIKQVSEHYTHYKWALTGGIVGCAAALIFNDSGVVAMAMIFIFLVPSTLYLMAGKAQGTERREKWA